MKVKNSSQHSAYSIQEKLKNLTTDYCLLPTVYCLLPTNKKGFTLIETIIVMVVVAILAAVVILRNPFDSIKLSSATRKVAGDIRYVQKLAISSQLQRDAIGNITSITGMTFNANGYSVYQNLIGPTYAMSPGDTCSTDAFNRFVVDFTDSRCSNYSSVTINIPPTPSTIYFNSLGSPVDVAGNSIGNQTVRVSYKGIDKDINIEAGTGRVSIQ